MSAIHKRILNEIKLLDCDEKIKILLRQALEYELEIIDNGRPNFSDKYLGLVNATLRIDQ